MSTIGPIVRPDIRTLFDSERQSAAVNINKIQIGQIVAWFPATQSANVQLVNKRVVNNTPMPGSTIPVNPTIYEYPLLVDVPVFVLGGGTAFIGMPILIGDSCIVLFNDRDLDPWWTAGTTGAPPHTSRVHSLADGIALVGVRTRADPVPDLPDDGQRINIGNASGNLGAAVDALLTALLNWHNTGGSTPDATTIAALTAVKALFDALLKS